MLGAGELLGAYRPVEGRVLAGVAEAFARRANFEPLAVRAAFVALSFVGGLGIALYVAAWLALPSESAGPAGSSSGEAARAGGSAAMSRGDKCADGTTFVAPRAIETASSVVARPEDLRPPIFRAALADRRTVSLTAGVASAIIALLAAVAALGDPGPAGAISPGVVALAALVAVPRHAGPEDKAAMRRLANLLTGAKPDATTTWKRVFLAAARALAGAALITLGTSHLLARKHLNEADIAAALSALGIVGGFSLVLAPWWLRLGRDLVAERRERARAEERAEVAAHLHDSVLQTLALIQRSADDPQQVRRLARAQERQLRSWLFEEPRSTSRAAAVPSGGPPRANNPWEAEPATVSAALKAAQEEVEEAHGIRVEVVTVGDAALDERLAALVAAAREAVVNAAKWSGADQVFVFAEINPKSASAYVRDRGRGFDPAHVPSDRKGISESLMGRMRRNGGSAKVRSSVGEGTEVTLEIPRRGEA
jgi:signal transduction histidine kinase/phage shock protein PspC (stress-responsive transcriptional regulator)